MKVSNEVRNIYSDFKATYSILEEKVKSLIMAKKNERWHYEGRIKTLESYATKLETGRHSPQIEDFFACTLVVENLNARKTAEELIRREFKLYERRPQKDTYTHKKSDSFPFDDLRLYVSWKDVNGSKPTGLEGVVFEVQIKTFLQHAWSIATHDMIYKSAEKDWAKERIAFQIKAMLEHAEISIQEADGLSKSVALNKKNRETRQLEQIISIIRAQWEKESLPSDLTRLADNINDLLKNLRLSEKDLLEILEHERAEGRGGLTVNLSPYGSIIQGLFNQKKEIVIAYLTGEESKFKLLITKDLDLPPEVDLKICKNIIIP